LNERLYHLRQSLGYSQDDFAQLLKIATRTYIRYEKGERAVPSDILIRIGKLGVNLNWLLTGQAPMWKKDDTPVTVAETGPAYQTARDFTVVQLSRELARLKTILRRIEELIRSLQD